MNSRSLALLVAVVVLLAAGIWSWRDTHVESQEATANVIDGVVQDASERRVLYWYDPMVPQQHFEKPGKSPFMDMQLVPKYADEEDGSALRISPAVQQNLGIRFAKVERTRIADKLAAVGRIEADERRRYAVPSRVGGFVERLYVRAQGDAVSERQKLAEVYSPELYSAQLEYLALMNASELDDSDSLANAARQRLVLLGMAESEIESIARSREARRRFGIYSPSSGFAAELNVREGAQIEAGATLMSIADLTSVWLIAEVPERDAARLAKGGEALARLEGAPEKAFSGIVDFIYPILNAETRTIRVRVVLPNKDGALRPGMFAHVSLDSPQRDPLSVPSEAVIYTGSRTVVIVKSPHGFRPVEVQTGTEVDGRTEIISGLSAGEEVVASGQFLIDSEASLSGAFTSKEEPR
jgi:membrane fusion protein, copper/silver efflux system